MTLCSSPLERIRTNCQDYPPGRYGDRCAPSSRRRWTVRLVLESLAWNLLFYGAIAELWVKP